MWVTQREIWIAANLVLERHGSDAPRFVAERIGALVLTGDAAGVDVWRAIAQRMHQLADTGQTSGALN